MEYPLTIVSQKYYRYLINNRKPWGLNIGMRLTWLDTDRVENKREQTYE